jgi:hypothetical protein
MTLNPLKPQPYVIKPMAKPKMALPFRESLGYSYHVVASA